LTNISFVIVYNLIVKRILKFVKAKLEK